MEKMPQNNIGGQGGEQIKIFSQEELDNISKEKSKEGEREEGEPGFKMTQEDYDRLYARDDSKPWYDNN